MLEKTENTPSERSRVHLGYLDGLRGLSAAFVVIYHVFSLTISSQAQYHTSAALVTSYKWWVSSGHQAVCIFIVLSGYCLMMPVFQTPSLSLKGGLLGFLGRRSRRILPPYYAALVCSALLMALTPGLRTGIGLAAANFPIFTKGAVISHLLMIQNLSPQWAQRIDGPMWSVATEWQIYFIFALLLLPVWKRLGPIITMALALIMGLLPFQVAPQMCEWWCPHFLALFSFGMVGAAVNFWSTGATRFISFLQKKAIPWTLLAGVLFLFDWAATLHGTMTVKHIVKTDLLTGLAASVLLIGCTRSLQATEGGNWLTKVLSSHLPIAIGAFSYSLYLLHGPVILAVQGGFFKFHATPTVCTIGLLSCVPIAFGVCYLLYLTFECPFMAKSAPKTQPAATISVIASSAP